MYQRTISTRIFFFVGIGLLIFSLVFGWVSFSVPDWLQFYEHNILKNVTESDKNFNDLKKFGLWYKCIFSIDSNDFICTLWNNDAPSFVRVAQVLVPMGLSFSCLSLLSACIALMSRRAFVTSVIFAALFVFLSFVFIIIGVTVFAVESITYVDRLKINNNTNPRRWGMWLLVPNLVLSFFTSICFIIASILNWCDYRSMKVTGIFSHSIDKLTGSVCKAPSESNTISALKKQYTYQDYPNGCYQLNGLNNPQQNLLGYPPPPSYGLGINPAYHRTPTSLFGYSRPGSPTMNQMYPYTNFDPYYPRNYMTENSEMDELPYMHRSRRQSRIRRHSSRRSASYSPPESTTTNDNNQKQPQFIPVPVPYYQPPLQQTQVTSSNNNNNPSTIPHIIPQGKQQFIEENTQPITQPTNILKYGTGQPTVLVSNPSQPIYTIAYRANNGGNVLSQNILTGPAATTYVTATKNGIVDADSFNSESDHEDGTYQNISKKRNLKKINVSEAWTWRKM